MESHDRSNKNDHTAPMNVDASAPVSSGILPVGNVKQGCCRTERIATFRCILVFLVLAQVVAAVAVVSYISYSAAASAGQQVFGQLMQNLMQRSRREVEVFMRQPIRTVRSVSQAIRIHARDSASWNSTHGFAPTTRTPLFSALSFILNQASDKVVTVAFGSPFGFMNVRRRADAEGQFGFIDNASAPLIQHVYVDNAMNPDDFPWNNVTESIPANTTLRSLLDSGKAHPAGTQNADVVKRTWYQEVSRSCWQ